MEIGKKKKNSEQEQDGGIQVGESLPFNVSEVDFFEDEEGNVFVKDEGVFYSLKVAESTNFDIAIVEEENLTDLEEVSSSIIQEPSVEEDESQTSTNLSRNRD